MVRAQQIDQRLAGSGKIEVADLEPGAQERVEAQQTFHPRTAGAVKQAAARLGIGKERLQQLTGRVLDAPSELRFSNDTSEDIQPLRDRLLLWAAILLIFDIAARKIDLRTLKLPEKKTATQTVQVGAISQLKQKKKTAERRQPAFEFREMNTPEPAPEPEPTAEPEASDYMKRLKDAKKRK